MKTKPSLSETEKTKLYGIKVVESTHKKLIDIGAEKVRAKLDKMKGVKE